MDNQKLIINLIASLLNTEGGSNQVEQTENNSSKDGFEHFSEIGKTYHIRTVTQIIIGRLTEVKHGYARFENASWISNTGRFSDWLKDGLLNDYSEKKPEVEPYHHDIFLNTEVIVDFTEWNHSLPTEKY